MRFLDGGFWDGGWQLSICLVNSSGRLYLRSSAGQQHVKMMPGTRGCHGSLVQRLECFVPRPPSGLFTGNATGQASRPHELCSVLRIVISAGASALDRLAPRSCGHLGGAGHP